MTTDLDELFPAIGGFGKFQKLLVLPLCFASYSLAIVYFSQVFLVLEPDEYWCHVPELTHMHPEERRDLAIPARQKQSSHEGLSHIQTPYDQCHKYKVDNWTIVPGSGNTSDFPLTTCLHGYEFNFTGFYSTVVTEFEWVCEDNWIPNLAQSIFFLGALIGTPLFSFISDRFGRRAAFILANLTAGIFGIATGFSTNVTTFLIFRCLVGTAYALGFTSMMVLGMEFVEVNKRTIMVSLPLVLCMVPTLCALPWIAKALANWRLYAIVIHAPLLLVVFTPLIVPESIRWRLSRGQIDQAMDTIRQIARVNGKTIKPGLLDDFKKSFIVNYNPENERTYTWLDLLRTPNIRKYLLLMCAIWSLQAIAFDGHARNTHNLGLNPYLSYSIASFTELPAGILPLLFLDVIGRRWSISTLMLLGGVFSIFGLAVPRGDSLSFACMSFMARFFLSSTFNIILQLQSEIFPTVIRSQGMGVTECVGHLSAFVAPFILYLSNYWLELPLLIMGLLSIMGSILILFVPETMGKELPETIEDGENFGKDQKFFDFPCIKRKPKQPNQDLEGRGNVAYVSDEGDLPATKRNPLDQLVS